MENLKKEELINILKYSYWMSRIIVPIRAKEIGLNLAGFDEISDFYRELINKIEKDEKIDFSGRCTDEYEKYLKSVYQSMKKDVMNKDIEHAGMFVHYDK